MTGNKYISTGRDEIMTESTDPLEEEVYFMKNMLFIDAGKCTGCRSCEIYCSFINGRACNPASSRVRVIKFEQKGINIPTMCMQCEDPPCMVSCPVSAIKKETESGLVVLDHDACIGCKLCMMNCPLGAISFDSIEGKVFKCNQCSGDPICAKMCATGAITFLGTDRATMMKKREGIHTFINSQGFAIVKTSGGE
jgi:carbon-monoxide dehydrogenase iron sulfur subunit